MKNTASLSEKNMEKLQVFQALLLKWQKRLNLVSNSTLSDNWNRHFKDSIQLAQYLPEKSKIWDLGSGAGFPGLVLSILGHEVTLIEKDEKKCIFMKEVTRKCEIQPHFITERLEELSADLFPQNGYFTARAFAPLPRIFEWTKQFQSKNPTYLLLKGEKTEEELNQARKDRCFDSKTYSSQTDSRGKILVITNVKDK